MVCKKCGSTDVNVQVVSEIKVKRRGLIYWLVIGWWLELLMWFFFTLPWLIIKIFKPKRTKTKLRKLAVCQRCGKTWGI